MKLEKNLSDDAVNLAVSIAVSLLKPALPRLSPEAAKRVKRDLLALARGIHLLYDGAESSHRLRH